MSETQDQGGGKDLAQPKRAQRLVQTNFTAGEISQRLAGRMDLAKYANGVAELVNMVVQPQGGVTRRTGSYYVGPVKNANGRVRLITFEVSTIAAYIVELGAGYARFYRNHALVLNGSTPVEVATPYSEAELLQLKVVQSADVLFICHQDHPPMRLSRTSATSFSLDAAPFVDGPWQDENTSQTTLTPGNLTGTPNVTASAPIFTADDVGRMIAMRDEAGGRTPGTDYSVGAVIWSYYAGTYRLYEVITGGTTSNADMTSGIEPPYDKGAPTEETSAVRDGTCVLKYIGRGKTAWGWGKILEYISPTVVKILIYSPLASQNMPVLRWRLGEWGGARGWPRCMTFHQGRAWYAGSRVKPQTVWASETGDFYSMSISEEDGAVLDTNAIAYTLDNRQVNTIEWLSSFNRGILAGCPSGEFVLSAADNTNAISPSNFIATVENDSGTYDIISYLRVGYANLFMSRSGEKLREVVYDYGTDSYKTSDLTQLNPEVTGSGVVDIAYQQEPDGTIWLVREDGALLSLTYDRDQEVRAWCRHFLGGTATIVESVASVPDPTGASDEIYLSVVRNIGGVTKRYIEYIGRPFDRSRMDVQAGFFVDCGLTYTGAPVSTVTGLAHLEGQTVAICADGATRPPAVVSGGSVTIPAPAASVVHVGLPYEHRILTLRPDTATAEGSGQAVKKRISRLWLRLLNSMGGSVGRDGDSFQDLYYRTTPDPMTQAVPLFTGDMRQDFPGGWDDAGQIVIRSSAPLPFQLLCIIMEVTSSG